MRGRECRGAKGGDEGKGVQKEGSLGVIRNVGTSQHGKCWCPPHKLRSSRSGAVVPETPLEHDVALWFSDACQWP